ncbi:MAG: YitT family protein [Chitinophagaceae bacterium]|nr:YitT family protein [Chitinophagaceae bacterium]MCA6497590.1 YitT family protein [Chitinophagaceae bacterium]
MRLDELYPIVIRKLSEGLPAYLTYHNVAHTRQVVDTAAAIGAEERLTDDEMILVKTAALLHDIGFLQSSENHEAISCQYAGKLLPDFGYSSEQIDQICSIILATKIPQSPQNLLAKIVCDADLFYLGTEEYSQRAAQLEAELRSTGVLTPQSDWIGTQINFLSEHHYLTDHARGNCELIKQRNLEQLRSQQAISSSTTHKKGILDQLGDFALMLCGVTLAALALKGFLVPNHFFDGGITGMALLLHESTHVNLGLLIVVLNLPLLIAGYFLVGLRFSVRMALAVLMLAGMLQIIPALALTSDKLLISLFGGVFLGTGVGLVMRAGAALDGIEVVALYTLRRVSFTITEIILAINVLIFSIAAFTFGLETALYSILTYFAATRSIDYVVEGIQAYTGVTIISAKSEVIKYQLVNNMGKGITVYKGERGFLPGKFGISNDCDILFTVITRLELRRLKNMVAEIDPAAFVFATSIKDTSGGIVKRIKKH